jgi:hypothetical protein
MALVTEAIIPLPFLALLPPRLKILGELFFALLLEPMILGMAGMAGIAPCVSGGLPPCIIRTPVTPANITARSIINPEYCFMVSDATDILYS